jgi:hypothetical protein
MQCELNEMCNLASDGRRSGFSFDGLNMWVSQPRYESGASGLSVRCAVWVVEARLVPTFKYLIGLAEFVGLQIARRGQEHYGMNL